MLNKTTELPRRVAMAAATILLTGAAQLACYVPPPPVAAEQGPATPAAATEQPADAQGDGQDDASIDDFYEPLAAYGTWVDTENYGKVWQPSEDVAPEGFTPYASDGSWVNNDDGDYVFQSKYDDEYGWATYHYGRWAEHDDYGWVWIPGAVWAPSWVEWRYGGGYVGWAPLGPAGYVTREDRWFFTEERHFGEANVYGYRLGPDRLHGAYMAASPIVEVHGRGHWSSGPPAGRLRSSGVAMRTAHGRAPGRGYTKAQAKSVKAKAGARAGRAPQPARKSNHAPQHEAHPAEHHDAPAAHHEAPAGHHEAPAAHHDAPEHHDAAHHEAAHPAPGVPATKPKPAPAPAKSAPKGKKH